MRLIGIAAFTTMLGLAAGMARAADGNAVGDRVAGEDVFIKCSGCHQVGPGAENSIGPELNGVVGRAAGSVAGYAYSAAMTGAAVRWDHDTLARFAADAGAVVPGTRMSFAGLKRRQDAEDLVAYLSQFDAAGERR